MEKYPVSTTTKFSDGTETTVNYVANPDAAEIEAVVAENNAGNNVPEVTTEVTSSEPIVSVDTSTLSGTVSSEVVA